MNEFDRLVIEEAIRARVGRVSSIDLTVRQHRTPMTVVLDTAERHLGRSVDVFWIDDGVPGHFSLVTEEHAAVVFHTRALCLTAKIRELYTADSLATVRRQLAAKVALQRISELLLARGHIDQALQTLAKANSGASIEIAEPDLLTLEYWPLTEQYVSTWFFGLTHELGHALAPQLRMALTKTFLRAERVVRVLNEVLQIHYDDESAAVLRKIIARTGSAGWCSPSVLQEEALADLFGFFTMLESSYTIIGKSQVNVTALASETLVAFNVLMLMEQCRVLARWFDTMESEIDNQTMALSNIALQVRANLLLHALVAPLGVPAGLSAWNANNDAVVDEEGLTLAVLELNNASEAITSGIAEARQFLSSAEMRDPEIFYSYVDRVAAGQVSTLDAERLVRLAQTLRKTSPQIELLSKVVNAFPSPAA